MNYYAWRVARKPVEVRLSLPMLGYMVPWIHDLSTRQAEQFGLLLGCVKRRWGRLITFIDDFEPFDPAKLRGRPKPPKGTDLTVVGLYRRHENRELKLDQLDASLIQSAFEHPWMVYLAVAPTPDGPDRATFYVQEQGEIHGYAAHSEFPFDAESLAAPPGAAPRKSRNWTLTVSLSASLLALGGWFFWLREDTPPPPRATAPTSAPAPAAVSAPAPGPIAVKAGSSTSTPERTPRERRPVPKHRKRKRR